MGSKFKVLLYEQMHEKGTELLREKCELIYATSLNEEDLMVQAADADAIIIRANGAVSRSIIAGSPKLKVIGRHGVGLDAIDLEAARDAGVRVVYTPNANTTSVAEHFVAFLLMLARKVRVADKALREGNWGARYELIGTELNGKTLGVMGFGKIGQETARICRNGLNMNVIYSDVIDWSEAEKELAAKKVDKETLFARADAISINLPLLPSTRQFINADLINLMKPSAFLINMARGPIWVEQDVVAALREGRIAGVASDVYEVEPAEPDNPLFTMDTFVGSPHMSAHTEEGMIRMSMVAADVVAVLEGREPKYPVC